MELHHNIELSGPLRGAFIVDNPLTTLGQIESSCAHDLHNAADFSAALY